MKPEEATVAAFLGAVEDPAVERLVRHLHEQGMDIVLSERLATLEKVAKAADVHLEATHRHHSRSCELVRREWPTTQTPCTCGAIVADVVSDMAYPGIYWVKKTKDGGTWCITKSKSDAEHIAQLLNGAEA